MTEMEEGQIWQAVVLQDDCLLNKREDPVQTANDPLLAAQITLSEICENFAWPIHVTHDVAHLAAGFRFALFILSRAVGYKQQFRGPGCSNCVEHSLRWAGPIEDHECYGHLQSLCRMQRV